MRGIDKRQEGGSMDAPSMAALATSIEMTNDHLDNVLLDIELLKARVTAESVVRQEELDSLAAHIQAAQADADAIVRKAVRDTARRTYPGWRDPGVVVE